MGYQEARELARIRQELRERLMHHRWHDAELVLARLAFLAEQAGDIELRSEYERWHLRFDLLAATDTAAGLPRAA